MAVLAERPSRVPFVSPFGTHPKHSLRNGVLWVMVGAVPVYPQLEPPRAAPGAEKRSRGAKEQRRKGEKEQSSRGAHVCAGREVHTPVQSLLPPLPSFALSPLPQNCCRMGT